jgi:hypothetical protein
VNTVENVEKFTIFLLKCNMVGRVVLFRYEISSLNPYSFGRYENISMISDVLVFITFVIAELFFCLIVCF